MAPWIAILRRAAENKSYVISRHAFARMGQNGISADEVEFCARTGEPIEVQFHGRDPKMLVQGVDDNGQQFYLVAALRYPEPPVIVTVCRFAGDAWNDLGRLKTRKR